MVLHLGSESPNLVRVGMIDQDHTVGIAHRDCGEPEAFLAQAQLLVDHLPVLSSDGDFRAPKARPSHLHRHERYAISLCLQLDPHEAPLGLDIEGLVSSIAMLEQVLGEDANPVATLLGLAPIGVEDPEAEGRDSGPHKE